jgi:serine/threonine protein phosphatase PrpC
VSLRCCHHRPLLQARQRTNVGNALAKAAAKAVMEEALAKGSKDNITVVAMLLDWDGHLADEPQGTEAQ